MSALTYRQGMALFQKALKSSINYVGTTKGDKCEMKLVDLLRRGGITDESNQLCIATLVGKMGRVSSWTAKMLACDIVFPRSFTADEVRQWVSRTNARNTGETSSRS